MGSKQRRERDRRAAAQSMGSRALELEADRFLREHDPKPKPGSGKRPCITCGERREAIWLTDGIYPNGLVRIFTFCSRRCLDRWKADNPFAPSLARAA